jgi:hypothetical protein
MQSIFDASRIINHFIPLLCHVFPGTIYLVEVYVYVRKLIIIWSSLPKIPDYTNK